MARLVARHEIRAACGIRDGGLEGRVGARPRAQAPQKSGEGRDEVRIRNADAFMRSLLEVCDDNNTIGETLRRSARIADRL